MKEEKKPGYYEVSIGLQSTTKIQSTSLEATIQAAIDALELKLNETLIKDFEFIDKFLEKYKNQKCINGKINNEIDKVSIEFTAKSLPAEDTKPSSTQSYYSKMVYKFQNLKAFLTRKFAVCFKNEHNSHCPEQDKIENEVDAALGKHENMASDFISQKYKKLSLKERELLRSPPCRVN